MPNDEKIVSVDQLIRHYNEELLAMKRKHDASVKKEEPSIPTMAEIDATFPVPNVEEDLARLRAEPDVNATVSEAENNAVNEEQQGQTSAAPVPPPAGIPPFPLFPTEEELLPPSAPPPQEMSLGYLKAFVTTARGALPISNAQVIVTRLINGEELLEQAVRTDTSGYTPLFTLPAVSAVYSLTPGNPAPFTYYNMYVRAEGFYPVRVREIPLYGGITAVQPIDLIPVAEGDDPNRERTVTEGAPEISKAT